MRDAICRQAMLWNASLKCCKLYVLPQMHDMLRRQAVRMVARLFSAVLCTELKRALNGAGGWHRHSAAHKPNVTAASACLAA